MILYLTMISVTIITCLAFNKPIFNEIGEIHERENLKEFEEYEDDLESQEEILAELMKDSAPKTGASVNLTKPNLDDLSDLLD